MYVIMCMGKSICRLVQWNNLYHNRECYCTLWYKEIFSIWVIPILYTKFRKSFWYTCTCVNMKTAHSYISIPWYYCVIEVESNYYRTCTISLCLVVYMYVSIYPLDNHIQDICRCVYGMTKMATLLNSLMLLAWYSNSAEICLHVPTS